MGQMEPTERTCEFCGKAYEVKTVTQRYCSRHCALRASATGRVRYISVTFTCAKCGRVVVTEPDRRDRRSRFCSAECERRYWRHPPHEHETARQNFRSLEEYAAWERRTNAE